MRKAQRVQTPPRDGGPLLPPHDPAAEQAVLGSVLLSARALAEVSVFLRPEHFYRPVHADIYRAALELAQSGEPVDALTVAAQLRKSGQLGKVGGAAYLVTVMQGVPSAMNAETYARRVYDRWRQRQLIQIGQKMTALGYAPAGDGAEVDALLAEADSYVRELGEPSRSGLGWDELVAKWRNWQREPASGIYTPWPDLNRWLPGGGFSPGQLVVIGGRPGHGKSNAGLNVVLRAARHGRRAVVFSVEMDDVEVCSRLLAAGASVKVRELFAKDMCAQTQQRLDQFVASSRGMPLEVVDQPFIRVEEIVAHCRARRPDVVFVDYTQLIEPTNSRAQREQQVAHITRTLKVAAKSLHMVVVAASQLRRIDRDNKTTPTISDLRESGAAEQDADVVILLHRADNSPRVTFIVGKNRNGPTGEAVVRFRGDLARVGDDEDSSDNRMESETLL